MVCSNVMAILIRDLNMADHTSTSPSSDYLETLWKRHLKTRAKI